jgi:hypothetical protein
MLSSCSLVAAAVLGVAVDRPHRWRLVNSSRPVPLSLSDAEALHLHARQQVEKEMMRHGHATQFSASPTKLQSPYWDPPPPVPPAGHSTTGSAGLISPTSFGADPTGKTDSTAAFSKAMAALLNTSAHADHPMVRL